MCAFPKRHRLLRSGMYDIDGFIKQLLASDKFDELAEKLAEKAANKIKLIEVDQAPGEKASRLNKAPNNTENEAPNVRSQSDEKLEKEYERDSMEIVKVVAQTTRARSEEKHEKKYARSSTEIMKGFKGKIDTLAVMKDSNARSENLKLKYKYLKKNLKNLRDPEHKNVTSEDRSKQNKTLRPTDDEIKNETERLSSQENGTQLNQHEVKMESIDEKKDLRVRTKDDKPKEVTKIVTVNSLTDDVHNESTQKEQDVSQGKAILEENSSSLDGELEKPEGVTKKIDTRESHELLKVLGYVKGLKHSVEENKVPSESGNLYLRDGRGVIRNEDSNGSGDRVSIESPPEHQRWSIPVDEHPAQIYNEDSPKPDDEDPAKPVLRKEGDKIYTYNQNPDYQEYHEEMAKWRKEHPKNPADFM